MKTKMVIWGSTEKDEKVLLALELLHEENKVKIYSFPAASVTEVFYNQMMNLWRNGGPVTFPAEHQEIIRELSMTDDLLPETILVERTDLINRAKTEWHFVVLSSKLRESYNSEIQDFKDKISALSNFDENMWEDLKVFWNKVQNQVREKNLFREHADQLRDNTNELFTKLKALKKSLNAEFAKVSKEQTDTFMTALKSVEQKVNDGLGLHPLFNELKELQNKFNNTEFTRSDRSAVWKKLDATFKLVKEKKFGPSGKDNNSSDRVNRRYNGLMSAIKKMESSIYRDKKDIEFQNNRIQTTEGQLEMQIRQAKLAMIQQRIGSKEEKLAEMMRTKESIEKKLEQEKKKQQKRDEQEKAKNEKEAAKAAAMPAPTDTKQPDASPGIVKNVTTAPAPIAKEGKQKDAATVEKESGPTKPTAEAEAIKKDSTSQEAKQTDTPAVDKETSTKPASAEDTVKKETPVEEKADEEKKPDQSSIKEEVAGVVVAAGAMVATISDTVEDSIEDVFDTVKAAASVLVDKVEDLIEQHTSEEE